MAWKAVFLLALLGMVTMTAPVGDSTITTACFGWVCATAMASTDGQNNDGMPDTLTYFCSYHGAGQLAVVTGTASGSYNSNNGEAINEMGECSTACTWVGQGGCGDDDSFVDLFEKCGSVVEQTATASQGGLVATAIAREEVKCSGGGGTLGSHSGETIEESGTCSFEDNREEQVIQTGGDLEQSCQ